MGEGLLRAFLFTDLVGSTALWDADGPAMSAALTHHDSLASGAVVGAGGVVFKHSGDGMCAVFDSPVDAVMAAVALQRALQGDSSLRSRMSIHFGPAEQREGDWFGSTLNRAARLMGIAHGGQVVLSAAAAAVMASARPAGVEVIRLGTVRLRGLADPEVVHQVVADGPGTAFPSLAGQALDTLPRPRTSFLGRDEEIGELLALLNTERMVTVAGVGGTGKTRLAIEVGRQALEIFSDGVLYAGLSEVDEDEGVEAALADGAGVQLGSAFGPGAISDPRATLLRALEGRDLLVVLDNCEHLVDPVADLVDDLLDRCPGVRILTTSREPLAVSGEQVWRVPALDDSSALALLIERARSREADFDLTDSERETALALCRRLDSLPLAIELAAARFSTLSVAEVADRLDDRFRLLAGRGRRHDRHATLRATLDWSYDLLDPDERLLLDRLSVFVGGFDLNAAEKVVGSSPLTPGEVVDLLTSLVEKSLVVVVVVDREGTRRFDLLETVRAYAADHLAERGETESVRADHARWIEAYSISFWIALAKDAARAPYWDGEVDNVRAAHAWVVERGEADAALWIAAALGHRWNGLRSVEGWRRCDESLALPGGQILPRHLCTGATAYCAKWAGDFDAAWRYARDALATIDDVPEAGPRFAWITALNMRAGLGADVEGPTTRECLEHCRSVMVRDEFSRAIVDFFEGVDLVLAGRPSDALPLLEGSLAPVGHSLGRWRLLFLAYARFAVDGDVEVPPESHDPGLGLGPVPIIGISFLEAVLAATRGAPYAEHLHEALQLAGNTGLNPTVFSACLAAVATAAGEHRTAAQLYGCENSWRWLNLNQVMAPRSQAALGDEEFHRLVAQGAALTDDEITALVLTLC